MVKELTQEELQKHLRQSKDALQSCVGTGCDDVSGTYTSLMSFVRVQTAHKKQQAYALNFAEIANGSSAAKAGVIMKASDEYRDYLIFDSYCEALLEQVRNMRAKGKNDNAERQMTP